ncbi:MAG: GNAT family N-acetyltransferase [Bacteroidetes bacterium]|nr:GNAT family N-acetyltransferase [Bacteroidota bacterium]
MNNIISANTDADILKCYDVMHELRPHLTRENICGIITGFMSRGYHLVYLEDDGKAACAAGFRFTEHLHWGKVIYVDDLSSLPGYRGKGYASQLLEYIFDLARKNDCDEVHLDSGCGVHRYDAHRLYIKKGFNITSFHFAKKI